MTYNITFSVKTDDILAYFLEQIGVEYTDVADAALENADAIKELLTKTSL